MLELRDLGVHYGRIHALRAVSLRVQTGEIVAVLGSNGAGKSTTLRAISGLLRPSGGQILLDGSRSAAWPRTGWWPRASSTVRRAARCSRA